MRDAPISFRGGYYLPGRHVRRTACQIVHGVRLGFSNP